MIKSNQYDEFGNTGKTECQPVKLNKYGEIEEAKSLPLSPEIDFEAIQKKYSMSQSNAISLISDWSRLHRWYWWPIPDKMKNEKYIQSGELSILFFKLLEKRSLGYEAKACSPGTKVSPFNPTSVWGIPVKLPNGFTKSDVKWEAPSPTEINNCSKCKGTGREKCSKCGGRGTVLGKCRSCHGTGKKPDAFRHRCTVCGGSGSVAGRMCVFCDGSGMKAESFSLSCDSCLGLGDSEYACASCHGSGYVTCSRCKGKGAMAKYPVVIVNYTVESNKIILDEGEGPRYPIYQKRLRNELSCDPCFSTGDELPVVKDSYILIQRGQADGVVDSIEVSKFFETNKRELIVSKFQAFLDQNNARLHRVGIAVLWRPYAICRFASSSDQIDFLLTYDNVLMKDGSLPVNPIFLSGLGGLGILTTAGVLLLQKHYLAAGIICITLGIASAACGWFVPYPFRDKIDMKKHVCGILLNIKKLCVRKRSQDEKSDKPKSQKI